MLPINLYIFNKYYLDHQNEYEKLSCYLNFLNKANEKISIKEHEWLCLASMISTLQQNGAKISDFEGFYFGYEIPQISKEFDLLRISSDVVVNIELKLEETDRIKEQLVRNRYYLSHLSREIVTYSYIHSKNVFYKYIDGKLILTSLDDVCAILANQKKLLDSNINTLFNVSTFLVSPLNNPRKFLNKEYFLTQQQEEVKNGIVNDAEFGQIKNYIINAGAGTGKTLLVYDIALSLSKNYKICIFHCGNLCEGHFYINDNSSISIEPIKWFIKIDISVFDFVIIDEAHRMYKSQLDKIIELAQKGKRGFILSLDNMQILSRSEERTAVYNIIIQKLVVEEYTLSKKIRTNKELAAFIKNMIDLSKIHSDMKYNNVEILYIQDYDDIFSIIKFYSNKGYTFINYTPSIFVGSIYDKLKKYKSAHQVIGQEFDKVMVILDNNFSYKDGKLTSTKKAAPNPDHKLIMLFYQQITRVRDKLCVLVVGNKGVFDNLLKIVTKN